jgi:hypothetical protein
MDFDDIYNFKFENSKYFINNKNNTTYWFPINKFIIWKFIYLIIKKEKQKDRTSIMKIM